MGQELKDNEAKLQQYLAASIGDIVNDLGGFVQFTIINAFNAGYEAGYEAAGGSVLASCQVLEYTHKADTTLKYTRKADGKYYPAEDQSFSIIPLTGWDKKSFEASEYIVTAVKNTKGVRLEVSQTVQYNNGDAVVVSFVEKAEDKILASLKLDTSSKLKIVDINELS